MSSLDPLQELDPTLAVSNVRSIESALAQSLARERISALISTSFGVGGQLLAALGLDELLALLVAERTKDIGIRIALGAFGTHQSSSKGLHGLIVKRWTRATVVATMWKPIDGKQGRFFTSSGSAPESFKEMTIA